MPLEFSQPDAEIFVPDGADPAHALERITHVAVGAHHDDLEIMAAHGILECFGSASDWFAGVVATDGAGSPRAGIYADYSAEDMMAVRRCEQFKAAIVGEYGVQILLAHPSARVKAPGDADAAGDWDALFGAMKPRVVYTHNLHDKHDTHVAVALRTLEAIRRMPEAERPERVYGCEVWRDLDWLCEEDKLMLDLSGRDHLLHALLGVFDSQIAGGKRYDLAAEGRRRAHATFSAARETDEETMVGLAVDLTPLIREPELDPAAFAKAMTQRFAQDVAQRIGRFQ